ncbi:MAG: hypothetical protein E7425_04110 [Ruminococcaceae bacterium]|nr:hypothetical protein [Oscillospiraceae bacterium]
MKSTLRRLAACALAAVLLLEALPTFASEALGHDLAITETVLNAETTLTSGVFWSDSHADLRQEHYVVYTPNERVRPLVTCGETTRALNTVLAAAQEAEAQDLRVVAGINGDYYGVQHGVPLGSTMAGGVLRNMNGDPYYAVGFRADGTALIGDPRLSMRAVGAEREVEPEGESAIEGEDESEGNVEREGFPVFAFNHIRQSDYGVFLYDSRFNDRGTTGTNEPGVDVLCSVVDGALTIGGALTLRVEEVLPEATDTAVPEGGYILTANLRADERYTAPLLALQPGDELTLEVVSETEDPSWNEVVNLIGAPELLVENGAVCAGLPLGSAPRTAIGQRADGTLIFYTIDGRKAGSSIGATLTAVAMRLVELECVTAVALDGGGSTTLVATMPDQTAAQVVNTPSENAERAVSNQLLLVADAASTGIPDHIYLSAETTALPGAQLPLRCAVVDTNYIPMDSEGQLTLEADYGSLEDGVLTVPAETGPVTVTARCGELLTDAVVQVIEPESILVSRGEEEITSLVLAPDSRLELHARGVANHLAVPGDDSCFRWTYEGEGVELSPEGNVLQAGSDAAVGTLTVSVGEKSVSIPVTVSLLPFRLLEDFETPFEPFTDVTEEFPELAPQLTLSRVTNSEFVRFGKASAQLDYTLDAGIAARLPVYYPVDRSYNCVELWVCGSGGSDETYLTIETDAGACLAVPVAFDGWEHIALSLPEGAQTITGLLLSASQTASGVLRLDQLVLAYDLITDDAPPEVSLSVNEELGTLTGRAFDLLDGAELPTLALTLDGAPLPYLRDTRTGELEAELPAYDALAHHIVLLAGDASGNLARASILIPAAEDLEPAFPDVDGHWAAGEIEFLKRTGVTVGSDGLYKPDDNISRQEFAVMLDRYLAPEDRYEDTAMPFADASGIASWAVEAARVMYALGIIRGSKDLNGSLCFNPDSSITRQEAATMLGRLLGRGFTAPPLTYADRADVPAWAEEQVSILSFFGVFDGFTAETFSPAQPLTRAEMASMLFRLR